MIERIEVINTITKYDSKKKKHVIVYAIRVIADSKEWMYVLDSRYN